MKVDQYAQIIWDYMHVKQRLQKSDAIFVLCSHDTRVSNRGAELFNAGYADWVIVSGGAGKLTKDIFDKPEAEIFKDILIKDGVPEDRIIVEPLASNTGENVRFVYNLLQSQNKDFHSFILVQKPYMERRTYATFKKQWPDHSTTFTVTSPKLSYEEYMSGSAINKDYVISVMVGDLERVREYPKLGYQIEQDIPDTVWRAYEELVKAGYDKHLLSRA